MVHVVVGRRGKHVHRLHLKVNNPNEQGADIKGRTFHDQHDCLLTVLYLNMVRIHKSCDAFPFYLP